MSFACGDDLCIHTILHPQVTIRILDINDNPPVLTQHSYRATVEETVDLRSPLVQLRAEDPDQGENSHVRYSIISGNNGGMSFSYHAYAPVVLLSLPLFC